MQEIHAVHEFEPVVDKNTKILILGTFPSVKSREASFYYGHPQNRFWKLLARLLQCSMPETIEEKKEMLLSHGVGIWDVIASCDITGSSDSSIKNVVPADMKGLFEKYKIKAVYANGKLAEKLYRKYSLPETGVDIIGLPSTSPANAAYSLDRLAECWKQILEFIN
ncbi:MAG: DNA-deoxyinosine glycosylase [Lachnospiraceae bacterium]|nr:DNA-deoxyinosine glycosylase [Lachnospiraceae bacterium]